MSEQISKERLAELIEYFAANDIGDALRELQERREREGSVMKPQSATPRTQKVYIADMEDTLTQLSNILGIPRDADLLIQRVRELQCVWNATVAPC